MSIQNISGAQPPAERRTPAAGQSKTSGPSFQEQLTAASAKAADAGRTAFTKDSLLSAVCGLKTTVLDRMRLSKEKTEEQQAWEKLMKYLDAWIDSLREETADFQKSARAYASLQAELTKDQSGRKDLGDYILEQLAGCL